MTTKADTTIKRTPEQVMADFREAWALEHDPAHVEIRYEKGWYVAEETELGYTARTVLHRAFGPTWLTHRGGVPCRMRANEVQDASANMRFYYERHAAAQAIQDSRWEREEQHGGFAVRHSGSLVHEDYYIVIGETKSVTASTHKKRPDDPWTPMTCNTDFLDGKGLTPEQCPEAARALEMAGALAKEWNNAHGLIEQGDGDRRVT